MFPFKTTRRITILAVIFVLILSSYSFGAKTNTKDQMNIPVYEEEIFGEGYINSPGSVIRINSQKQLVVYDSGRYNIMDLNGKPVRQIKPDFTGDGHIFALDSKDNLYVLVQDRGAQETHIMLYVYSPKGEKLKVLDLGKIGVKNGQPNFIWDMAVDSKGVVYVAIYNEGLIVVSKDAKSPKDFRSGDYTTIAVDGEDNLIVKGYKSSSYTQFIDKIKMPGGEVTWEAKLDSTNYITRIHYNPADKNIYALGQKRIEKYNTSGKLGGVVFDLFQNDLLAQGLNVDDFIVDQANNIYIVVTQVETIEGKETGTSCIKKFTPVTSAKQDKNQKTITIALPKSWGVFLENACAAFREKHPEIKVNIKEYIPANKYSMIKSPCYVYPRRIKKFPSPPVCFMPLIINRALKMRLGRY